MSTETLFARQQKLRPWRRFLYGTPVSIDAQPPASTSEQEVFVTTGTKVIDDIRDYVLYRRNVMLVGPRGTGKSYMARKAVEAIEADPRFGVVATISLQGDPNKPPSDYFDDGIIFRVDDSSRRGSRVLPSTVKAPFFSRAERSTNPFEFDRDSEGRLMLFKEVSNGDPVRVDRVVLFWDEGNRSSPAMQNSMLSLLAEGIIRRDGIDYVFPPISCILTRNPDGYDAQSAKMPSPLVDRFGVQLYVYNPDIEAMCTTICPAWYEETLLGMKIEIVEAIKRLLSIPTAAPSTKTNVFCKLLEQELVQDKAARSGKLKKAARPILNRYTDAQFTPVIKELTAIEKELDAVRTGLGFLVESPDTLQADAHLAWVRRCLEAVKSLAYFPELTDVKDQARVIALVILSTWGDNRSISEKPGLQYLPSQMRKKLTAIGDIHPSIGHAQRRLGELTRYGTSIRAFVDMLEVLCRDAVSQAIANPPAPPHGFTPVKPDLQIVRNKLAQLLNHRCEPAFNPDREPEKSNSKTDAMIQIADAILINPTRARKIAI